MGHSKFYDDLRRNQIYTSVLPVNVNSAKVLQCYLLVKRNIVVKTIAFLAEFKVNYDWLHCRSLRHGLSKMACSLRGH